MLSLLIPRLFPRTPAGFPLSHLLHPVHFHRDKLQCHDSSRECIDLSPQHQDISWATHIPDLAAKDEKPEMEYHQQDTYEGIQQTHCELPGSSQAIGVLPSAQRQPRNRAVLGTNDSSAPSAARRPVPQSAPKCWMSVFSYSFAVTITSSPTQVMHYDNYCIADTQVTLMHSKYSAPLITVTRHVHLFCLVIKMFYCA